MKAQEFVNRYKEVMRNVGGQLEANVKDLTRHQN